MLPSLLFFLICSSALMKGRIIIPLCNWSNRSVLSHGVVLIHNDQNQINLNPPISDVIPPELLCTINAADDAGGSDI